MPHSHAYTPATLPILRWLTGSREPIHPDIEQHLLGELFTSPAAVLMGVLNGLVLNVAALVLCHELLFVVLMAVDLLLAVTRLLVLRRVARAVSQRRPTPTDACLGTAILWSALQGSMSVACWNTGSQTLQILSAATILGLLGPLCARNYAAPRLALLLVALCDVPFVTAGALSGNPWMLVLVLQMPLYLLGSLSIVKRFRALAVASLQARHDSQQRAHHDPLTGLRNRLGFAEAVETGSHDRGPRFAVFYIDLDGFKEVNDSLGHHAGDLLLSAAALRLSAVTRPDDIAARFGGDEFIIVAHDMTTSEADLFARRVVDSITTHPYALDGHPPVRIGASVGFSCAPTDGTGLEELCRKADIALYAAKAGGRGIQQRFAA